jgi:hypothetical protein
VALLNAPHHAVFTSFTAAQCAGLTGWDRPVVHLLVAGGSRIHRVDGIAVVVHYAFDWSAVRTQAGGTVTSSMMRSCSRRRPYCRGQRSACLPLLFSNGLPLPSDCAYQWEFLSGSDIGGC